MDIVKDVQRTYLVIFYGFIKRFLVFYKLCAIEELEFK